MFILVNNTANSVLLAVGFKKPGFYVTVLHYVADGIVYPFKVLWHLLC